MLEYADPEHTSWWRRVGAAALAGAITAAAVAAVEAVVILLAQSLRFPHPAWEVLHAGRDPALFGAIVGALLALLVPRVGWRAAADFVLGLLLVTIALEWTQFRWQEVRPFHGARAWINSSICLAIAGVLFAAFRVSGRRLPGGRAAVLVAVPVLAVCAAQFAPRPLAAPKGLRGEAPEGAPNIVMVVIDTLRADHLSCYGYHRPTSPVMDELAGRGGLFETCWSQAPWTRPSVASIMTSLYPSSHNTHFQSERLPEELPTLAEHLQSEGWETAAFSASVQVSPHFGFGQGFDHFWNRSTWHLSRHGSLGRLRLGLKRALANSALGQRLAERSGPKGPLTEPNGRAVNARILDWLPTRDRARPLFLYVQYLDPHSPYDPPEDLLNESPLNAADLNAQLETRHVRPWPLDETDEPSADVLEDLCKLYDAEIRYVDRALGELLDELERQSLLDHAFVVVTADHGEELYDHQHLLHGNSLFEELLHVPLLVVGPTIDPRRIPAPVELIDVFPTVAELAGVPVDHPVQGVSLVPWLQGETPEQDRVLFAERAGEYPMHAVRVGTRKLVALDTPDGPVRMEFDLGVDPEEHAGVKRLADVDLALEALLEERWVAAGELVQAKASKVAIPADQQEALRALGYTVDEDR